MAGSPKLVARVVSKWSQNARAPSPFRGAFRIWNSLERQVGKHSCVLPEKAVPNPQRDVSQNAWIWGCSNDAGSFRTNSRFISGKPPCPPPGPFVRSLVGEVPVGATLWARAFRRNGVHCPPGNLVWVGKGRLWASQLWRCRDSPALPACLGIYYLLRQGLLIRPRSWDFSGKPIEAP